MKKLSFKEKLEIVRNIIRESLSGNAAFALLVYSLLHSLPIKTFADLFVTILLFIAIIAVVIWLFLIIYGRCEQVPDMRSSYSSGAHPRGTS